MRAGPSTGSARTGTGLAPAARSASVPPYNAPVSQPAVWTNADLHCHSVVSDGTLQPEELAARAKANGVELWALTDHDEIGGQHPAAAPPREHGMRYLTGTEISLTFARGNLPLLGPRFRPGD